MSAVVMNEHVPSLRAYAPDLQALSDDASASTTLTPAWDTCLHAGCWLMSCSESVLRSQSRRVFFAPAVHARLATAHPFHTVMSTCADFLKEVLAVTDHGSPEITHCRGSTDESEPVLPHAEPNRPQSQTASWWELPPADAPSTRETVAPHFLPPEHAAPVSPIQRGMRCPERICSMLGRGAATPRGAKEGS